MLHCFTAPSSRTTYFLMSSSPEKHFSGLLAEELSVFESIGQVRLFRGGDTVFSAGDPGDGFYVIESGRVNISAVVGNGELRSLAVIGPGDFFGEMAVLDDAKRSATATAETETKTFFLGRDQLIELLEHRPHFALNLIREFSARMRALNKKYLDEIIQAERLAVVGRFAGTIVHDFKNPLTTISLTAELSGSENTPPPVRRRAQHQIARQIVRMTNMLNELIDFTRPSDRRPPLVSVNFADFLTPLLEELRDEIAGRNVILEPVNPPPSVKVRIQSARFPRLFYNLINNAVDAMRGGGKIFLRFKADEGKLQIEIEDTGPGIAPEIAQHLFEPFTTHGKEHGTGLGLSICKKIVEDHDGRIWVRSEAGKGAIFCVTLPLPG